MLYTRHEVFLAVMIQVQGYDKKNNRMSAHKIPEIEVSGGIIADRQDMDP
jgi:hypothetical protein